MYSFPSFPSFDSVMTFVKLFSRLLLIPAVLGLATPMTVEAGGEKHKGHHDHHSGHMNMGDSYPSIIIQRSLI